MINVPDISDLLECHTLVALIECADATESKEVPLTAAQVEQLKQIVNAGENSLMPVLSGLAAIGRVLGEVDGTRDPDVVSNLGWLVLHLAKEAQAVESLKSDAQFLLVKNAKLSGSK